MKNEERCPIGVSRKVKWLSSCMSSWAIAKDLSTSAACSANALQMFRYAQHDKGHICFACPLPDKDNQPKWSMVRIHQYWIYIVANATRSVLYIGVTNDLYRRLMEHRTGRVQGFTHRYRCHYLMYYEFFSSVEEAIAREKALKGWKRERKNALISSKNPFWQDLSGEVFGPFG